MNHPFRVLTLAVFLVLVLATPVAAAEPGSSALLGDYWEAFVDYWEGVILQQNGIVMAVLGVGIVALFIITRGKWQK